LTISRPPYLFCPNFTLSKSSNKNPILTLLSTILTIRFLPLQTISDTTPQNDETIFFEVTKSLRRKTCA
jgi:hypothetical protein